MNDMVSTKLDIIEENLLLPSDFVYEFKANRKYSGDFISKYLLHDNKSLLFTDYDRDKSIEDKSDTNSNCKIVFGVHGLYTSAFN